MVLKEKNQSLEKKCAIIERSTTQEHVRASLSGYGRHFYHFNFHILIKYGGYKTFTSHWREVTVFGKN